MIAESFYKTKFEILSSFIERICRDIKKEIKQEFVKKNKLLLEGGCSEFESIVRFFSKKIIQEGDEEIGEWVASQWIFKHAEIFQLFHEKLSQINPKYETLDSLPFEAEEELKNLSQEKFGILETYVFSVLNSVVFSQKILDEIREGALNELSSGSMHNQEELILKTSLEEMKVAFELEKQKMSEKYEKRLQGVLKKYQMDMEGYRKQVGKLQKKIEEMRV